MWYAACYGRTRATADTAPYPGDAALAVMQALFVSLWRLAAGSKELALLTFERCKAHAMGTSVNVAAPDARSVELKNDLNKGMASISKSRCAYMLVVCVAHAARAIFKAIMSQLCVTARTSLN